MSKIIGIVGSGIVGRNPFDERCWSGSSKNLFEACQRQGILEDAFGVEVHPFIRSLLIGANFSTNKRNWREKFNLSCSYYKALTREVGKKLSHGNLANKVLFQIGAIYDVPSIANGNKCVSYHDGNIAQKMQSPYFNSELSHYAIKARNWEKQVYDKLTKIFTMSEYLRQSFIDDFNQPESKVVNIGVGANFKIPAVINKQYDNKEVVFIGIDFLRKGGECLVKAFDKIYTSHPDAILHIIGPREVPHILKQRSRPYIKFHGFLSRNDATQRELFFDILNRSTLGVLVSEYEPFGIALLELMAYGTPCIATNQWAFPEILLNGELGGLVPVRNVDVLAEQLNYYLSSPNLRERQGTLARQYVLSKYDWDLVAKTIKENL